MEVPLNTHITYSTQRTKHAKAKKKILLARKLKHAMHKINEGTH